MAFRLSLLYDDSDQTNHTLSESLSLWLSSTAQQLSRAHYSPLQLIISQYSQAQPCTAQYSPLLPSATHYNPLESSTYQYSPDAVKYSPAQPSTTQYSPIPSSTTHYSQLESTPNGKSHEKIPHFFFGPIPILQPSLAHCYPVQPNIIHKSPVESITIAAQSSPVQPSIAQYSSSSSLTWSHPLPHLPFQKLHSSLRLLFEVFPYTYSHWKLVC